jgi:nucleoid-associated protein YgaU
VTELQRREAARRLQEEARKAADAARRALETARQKIASAVKPQPLPPPPAAPRRPSQPEQGSAVRPIPRPVPASAACAAAGEPVAPPGWYIVKPGDSYWRIADLHYQKGSRWRVIHRANGRAGVIHPCQHIYVPR